MKPSDDFTSRLSEARKLRRQVEPEIKEAYSFCAPGREKDFDTRPLRQNGDDAENLHAMGEELANDLATDLTSYYFPDEQRWASYDYTIEVPEDAVDQVQAEIQRREDATFDMIEASNFNEVKPAVMLEAAIHGTPAIWVDTAHLTRPVHVQVVPPSELLILPGHLGYLDRFREIVVPARTLEALLPDDAVLSEDVKKKISKVSATAKVCWGFWLDWSDSGNPVWLREITVDGKRVSKEKENIGPMAGSCPLCIGRFNAWPGRAWGRGAGLKSLPDLRLLNKLDEIVLEGLDRSLMNTIIYPDDGFLDLTDGIVPGTATPAGRAFDRNSIYELPTGTNLDLGFFTEDKIEERLRKGFFQDGPRQRGDTPPSATQWSDERRMAQRRLGKPSAAIFTELGAELIQRIEKIGVEINRLEDAITHAGNVISLTPISPLQVAADLDKVMTTRSNLDLIMQSAGPEGLVQTVNMRATLDNIITATGDKLLVLNEESTDAGNVPPATAPPQPGGPAA